MHVRFLRGLVVISAAALLVGAVVELLACSGVPLPPGYTEGPVNGVPSTCDGDAYLAVPSSDCPESHCFQAVAFAVCDGTSFSGCTCQQPPGVLIPELDAAGAPGCVRGGGFSSGPPEFCTSSSGGSSSSGGFSSSSSGGSSSSSSSGGSSSGGTGNSSSSSSAPFFDAGNRGDCEGMEAERVPASECKPCHRDKWAYLLCDGLFYSRCSCELPVGYDLVPGADGGGKAHDAGKSKDSGAKG